jgi:hypothetical protein
MPSGHSAGTTSASDLCGHAIGWHLRNSVRAEASDCTNRAPFLRWAMAPPSIKQVSGVRPSASPRFGPIRAKRRPEIVLALGALDTNQPQGERT